MLSKILSRWLNNASNNDEQAKINNLPKHEQARLAVMKVVERKSSQPFNPITAATVYLQCSDSNIVLLTQRINSYTRKLELSEGLTPQDCFAEIKTLSLDQFFTDTDEMYISLDMVDAFVLTCRALFEAIDQEVTNNGRDVEYSLRLMGKCFSSIQNVCKAIGDAAH